MGSNLVFCVYASNSNVEPSVQSNWFTWTSKVHGFALLHRLDRILMNENWFSTWPSSRIRFLPKGISDNSPILFYPGF